MMKTYISLLRGINIGSKNKISMKELQSLYGSMGFKNVKTYINSGNVVFKARQAREADIETAIKKRFSLDIRIINRTSEELKKIIEKNPFKKADQKDLAVLFLSAIPKNFPKQEIDGARQGKEEYALVGKEIFLFLPNGFGRSRLAAAFTEKRLGVASSARNWNTTLKLFELSR